MAEMTPGMIMDTVSRLRCLADQIERGEKSSHFLREAYSVMKQAQIFELATEVAEMLRERTDSQEAADSTLRIVGEIFYLSPISSPRESQS